MVLEAVMICLDNSDHMRNGDYSPTRFQAQQETVHFLSNAKIQGNMENTCGVLSMAGRVEVQMSPARTMGKLMTQIKTVKIGGSCNFMASIKTAQLALKNRQNKNQRQRIILFVGSPVECDGKKLTKLGKQLKKNNVAVDIINFGTESTANLEKLEAFVSAANSSDNSHLVTVPPGPHVLSDLVLTSPIMVDGSAPAAARTGGSGVSGTAASASAGGHLGGIDPNEDPEMAMVLRMSMEEERQRQERAAKARADEAKAASTTASVAATATAADVAMADAEEEDEDEDEDEDDDDEAALAQAIALSMMGGDDDDDADDADTTTTAAAVTTAGDDEVDDGDIADMLEDPAFMASLLEDEADKDVELDDILEKLTADDDDMDTKGQ